MSTVTEIRRQLVRLIAGVVVVHALALALLTLTPLRDLRGGGRTVFTAVWVMLTLAVVLPPLQRIRQARLRARHAARAAGGS